MKTPRRKISGLVNPRKYSAQIPDDLITEILSRLPAKSVARCRCVSKLWYSKLSLPCFSELLLTRSSTRPQLLFSYKEKGNLLFFSSPQSQNTGGYSLSLVTANYQTKFPIYDYPNQIIIGSIHGLVCVSQFPESKIESQMVAVICNPTTGQSLTLPKLKAFLAKCFLGYDPIDKQYKVLSMVHPGPRAKFTSWDHQILTLGTENPQWRKVKCSINCLPLLDGNFLEGICISGVLYYVAFTHSEKGSEYMIVCFDVRSEKFRSIKGDKDLSLSDVSVLVNYKGKLAALVLPDRPDGVITRKTRIFEMWVLENAEKHEWSKHVYKFPYSFLKKVVREDDFYFVGVTGTNEIVLCPMDPSNPFIVVYYNIEKKTIRRDEIQGMDADQICIGNTFVNHVENVGSLWMHHN